MATPTARVAVIAQGSTIALTINPNSTYSTLMTKPGTAPETTTGTWTASTDRLTLRQAGVSFDIQFDMTLSGNTLTLNGRHVQYDVNHDGTDEEAILDMRLARQ